MKVTILEVTQVPAGILDFCQEILQVEPDFYGKVDPGDLYCTHVQRGGECSIQFFKIIDGILWVQYGDRSPQLQKMFLRLSAFIHTEVKLP